MKPHVFRLAKAICQTLFDAGYIAYFAGGYVRDHLLGIASDDIDIATSASPEIIQTLFPKTVAVGIAFGVVVVVLEGEQFEVTTFRKDLPYHDGRHPEGVNFSSPEQDAERRDFTINGMFYDPLANLTYDYVGGELDLKKGIIRAIGDPQKRFEEDRLRMLRAVRFSARYQFQIETETAKAIQVYAASLFPAVSMERVWQELVKMTQGPHLDKAFLILNDLGLLSSIFPHLSFSLQSLASFPSFPPNTPPVVYILQLFPTLSLEEIEALCLYLKTSKEERKIAAFFVTSDALLQQKEIEAADWAKFYAHPLSSLYLAIYSAKLKAHEKESFQDTHLKRWHFLLPHIERLHKKTPLVTSSDLKSMGVQPGKKMGELLALAERIAINENYHQKSDVLKQITRTIINDVT